jgi:hypothetical protein
MNVTVSVAASLRAAFDGRSRLELGVPNGADLGDVVHTLVTLYPKLLQHLPNDRKPVRQFLSLVMRGERLYLFGSAIAPPPLVAKPSRG